MKKNILLTAAALLTTLAGAAQWQATASAPSGAKNSTRRTYCPNTRVRR